MEVRKITKKDSSGRTERLFVEISKAMKDTDGLPPLRQGDEVLLLPRRRLSQVEMDKLVGKYVKYLDIDQDYILEFEGIIERNKPEYWDSKKDKEARYMLLDPSLAENPEDQALDAFNHLNDIFDLIICKDKQAELMKKPCSNRKCKHRIPVKYPNCPWCKTKNKNFQR